MKPVERLLYSVISEITLTFKGMLTVIPEYLSLAGNF